MQRMTKTIIKLAIITAVVIIPLMYSYFYLGAFWDPYSQLEQLPVAIVNNDTGAKINNEQRNLGNELCDELKKDGSLKFVFTNQETAESGTEDGKYYAMLSIPTDFSAKMATADSVDKKIAKLTFSSNEKHNYLASQILNKAVLEIEEKLIKNSSKEIVQTLSDKLYDVPDKLKDLQDGLNKLNDGGKDLNKGAKQLKLGTNEYSKNYDKFNTGVSSSNNGVASISDGASKLDKGVDSLLTGINQLTTSTENIGDITTGAAALASGVQTFNQSFQQYTTGVKALVSNVEQTSSFLTTYVTKVNPSIMADSTFASFISSLSKPENVRNLAAIKEATSKLEAASNTLSTSATTLSSGTASLPDLKNALLQLKEGLNQIKSGSAQLATGTAKLSTGMKTLSAASKKLNSASSSITDGSKALANGASKLSSGINTAAKEVKSSVASAKKDTKKLDGLATYAKNPVEIKSSPINPVPNYGTAFAPYFLSLSLWVGALMIFFGIYLDTESRFEILNRRSKHRIVRSLLYLVIGIIQAILLASVLKAGLGLHPNNPVGYYLSCILVSMVSIAMVQFFLVVFKDVGKFLSILMLILQLTSCGGTFPMELVPKFFNVLYPFMPMTYAVGLFRDVISGTNGAVAMSNAWVLLSILFVFVAGTLIFKPLKPKVAKSQIS